MSHETRPGPVQRVSWALTRLFLSTVGRSSEGLRICYESGLTSGTMLDYVYRNRPTGRWLIGPAIDRAFLEAPGWQAVRERRRNLETLLAESIEALRQRRRPVSLLDVASGPGAYVLAVLERAGGRDVVARCRDLDEAGLARGREERRGIESVTFEKGDALDREAILALRPRPNLAVASGFYDWITDDDLVRRSLAIVAEALEPGGFFVVTNQSAHPNLEFVSAVFPDLKHEPLRMKMRAPSIVESWLREAGLVIERTLSDAHGYYSVTRARRPEAAERTAWTSASTT
jgi:SAM-dependent methyltransferase